MTLLIWGAFLSLAIGAAVTFAAPRLGGDTYRVTRLEFVLGAALCVLIVTPATVFVGNKVAVSNNLRFDEYWNGWETAATRSETKCRRDGSCHWEYDCDPYDVTVTKTRSVSDGNGGTKTETYTETETRWHECPYVTSEFRYVVETTLGSFTIADHRLPDDPERHRWRSHKGISAHLKSRAGVGAPAAWTQARARLDAGDPGPVTSVESYDNYILASQHSTLRKLSGDIDRYTEASLIPDPASGTTYDHYRAHKTHLLGLSGEPISEWRDAVDRLGAGLGTRRQGDLHLVAVDAAKVDDADTYAAALMASWSSPERGKGAIAKNAVVVIVGVADGKVAWARLDTGMPVGNERLAIRARNDLPGVAFTPDALVGWARFAPAVGDGIVDVGDGALGALLFDPAAGFERTCMVCEGGDDNGLGFSYLSGEIRPTGGQSTAIVAVAALFALAIWAAFAAFAVGPTNRRTAPWSGLNSKERR